MRVPAPGGVGKHSGLAGSLRSAGYRRKKSTSFWSRTSIPTTWRPDHSDGSASFQMPMFTSRRPQATLGCRRIVLRRRGRATVLPECAASQRRTSRRQMDTFGAPNNRRRHATRPLPVIPRHTGYDFRKGPKILFLGDIVHALASNCSIPRSPRFSIRPAALRATRHQLRLSSRAGIF